MQSEHKHLWELHDRQASVLVVGGDYWAVEWACDLRHHFSKIKVTLVDSLPRCLTHLPLAAAQYAQQYMEDHDISTFYGVQYSPDDPGFWRSINLPECVHEVLRPTTYVLTGLSPRSSFMPSEVLSQAGPGGMGGWIISNQALQVCQRNRQDRPGKPWANGRVFVAGDCHFGAVAQDIARDQDLDPFSKFAIPPVPKTAFAAARWATAACSSLAAVEAGRAPEAAGWPHEAGIIAVSLGPEDGLVVWKVDWRRDSGEVVLTGQDAAKMKALLDWPQDLGVLMNPGQLLNIFQAGLSGAQRFRENLRALLRLQGRAW